MGTFAAPQNFPIRNRTISGLSLGVLVVEAGEYSRMRITARCALGQGRDIFAVPANVTSRNSWSANTLIKQGAKLTATWEDVWEELPAAIKLQLEANWRVESPKLAEASLFADSQLSPHEKSIYTLLKPDEAAPLDVIIEKLRARSHHQRCSQRFLSWSSRENQAASGQELRQDFLALTPHRTSTSGSHGKAYDLKYLAESEYRRVNAGLAETGEMLLSLQREG